MKIIIAILLAFAAAQAATHSATLTWSDTQNPSGTTYTIYRATGLCSGTPTFAMLAAGVTAMTYVDTTVTTGNYCYGVEAVFSGVSSVMSPTVVAAVPDFAPVGLTVTTQ
jgi:fibronectin type 3 domain-containing protein